MRYFFITGLISVGIFFSGCELKQTPEKLATRVCKRVAALDFKSLSSVGTKAFNEKWEKKIVKVYEFMEQQPKVKDAIKQTDCLSPKKIKETTYLFTSTKDKKIRFLLTLEKVGERWKVAKLK